MIERDENLVSDFTPQPLSAPMTKEQPTTKPLATDARKILHPEKRSGVPSYVLVIHGGAGTMHRDSSTPEKRAKYRAALSHALKAGYEVLKLGGEAMDAAVAAVTVLEGKPSWIKRTRSRISHSSTDCPLFNAGKGAVFNVAGKVRRRFTLPSQS